jgi:hypothetical protein
MDRFTPHETTGTGTRRFDCVPRRPTTSVAAVRDEAVRFLRDSFYVTVGFGVLTFQKMQVQRREIEKTLDRQLAGPKEQIGRLLGHEHDPSAR